MPCGGVQAIKSVYLRPYVSHLPRAKTKIGKGGVIQALLKVTSKNHLWWVLQIPLTSVNRCTSVHWGSSMQGCEASGWKELAQAKGDQFQCCFFDGGEELQGTKEKRSSSSKIRRHYFSRVTIARHSRLKNQTTLLSLGSRWWTKTKVWRDLFPPEVSFLSLLCPFPVCLYNWPST